MPTRSKETVTLPILLVGPTGTGKELFAHHIHERSGQPGPLVEVNCCALPRDMVESLLFGHRRGAFTGAIESTVGYVERSDGGTLFLDELESLAFEAQGKLLRVLETGDVERLGIGAKRHVDLRVVSAVQDDISGAVDGGRFRRDLFQRVAGVVIKLPPLSTRPEDVVPLAEHFAGLRGRLLEVGVARVLLDYPWPGNVRELRLAIERAGDLAGNRTLPAAVVAEAIELGVAGRHEAPELPSPSEDGRRKLLLTCEALGWDTRRITQQLRITRVTLYRRLRALGVSLREAKKYHVVSNSSETTGYNSHPSAGARELSR
ncbi:MAG: hypothetical protein DMD52_09745 [Gemmatimonadetes bacterium]|nr:MAG: hypothetical protein DMD52_09745 [Gemmatimonadota bacterium]